MKWLRRIAAAFLLLLCLICVIGSVRIFRNELPDSSVGSALTTAFVAAAFGIGAFFLIRPDLLALRGLTFARVRDWVFVNPIGQAALLFAAAVTLMLASPKSGLVFALVAVCVFSVWGRLEDGLPTPLVGLRPAVRARLDPSLCRVERDCRSAQQGFGEGAMVFLLPMQGFPVLLAASGLVRWTRKHKPSGPLTAIDTLFGHRCPGGVASSAHFPNKAGEEYCSD
jgi:hypothetical protein